MVGFFGAFFGQVPFRDLLFSEPRNNRSLFALQKASKAQKPLTATVAAFEALVKNKGRKANFCRADLGWRWL